MTMLRILPLVALLGRSRAMSVRSATTAGPLRVLCLHGKGGSAREFAERTKFVSELLPPGEVELVCVDAPHSLGEGRGFAWWSQAPDGARSYEAERFVGADESLAAIRTAWTDQPFDALLGHSQGAMLAAMVVAGCAGDAVRPRAAIMTGAAWPRPFGDALRALAARDGATIPPTLHVLGRADGINPPEMGLEVAECCGAEALVHWHDGGHIVPSDAASCEVFRAFLARITERPEG